MEPDIASVHRPQTLRGRLTLAYATSLVLALVAFALLALAVIDQSQRRALDAELAATAHTAETLVEPSDLESAETLSDRGQFSAIAGKVDSAIFRRNGSLAIGSSYAVPPAIRSFAARAMAPTYATLVVAGDSARVFAVPVMGASRYRLGFIATWRDAESIGALDRSVAIAFALAIPLLAAIAIVAGSAIAKRGLAPLAQMAATASAIEAHDLTQRLDLPPRDDELGRLAATLDRMLGRLQGAFDRERRFTNDASHELRAPLSVIRAEADLALRRERDGAEYRRTLETIALEADALEALTRNLLAAARADTSLADELSVVDVGAVARVVAERFAVLVRARSLRLECELAAHAVTWAERSEIERALIAVVDNAVKYAAAGGKVEIEVRLVDDQVAVRVTDDGPGFSAQALERAFERFWRGDETRTKPGSGLGLGIAKTIVERYGGTVTIANAERGGAVVRLLLPAKRSTDSNERRRL